MPGTHAKRSGASHASVFRALLGINQIASPNHRAAVPTLAAKSRFAGFCSTTNSTINAMATPEANRAQRNRTVASGFLLNRMEPITNLTAHEAIRTTNISTERKTTPRNAASFSSKGANNQSKPKKPAINSAYTEAALAMPRRVGKSEGTRAERAIAKRDGSIGKIFA